MSEVESVRVCHVIGSLGHGGRESLLEDIIQFSPEGIDYSICGLRVRAEHGNRFEKLGADIFSCEARSDRDYRALIHLGRYLSRHSFDIVHAHGPRAQIPCRLIAPIFGRSHVVSTMHGVPSMFPDRLLSMERLTRFIDDRTIAVSEGVKKAFVENGNSTRWVTIQNGIDVDSFHERVVNADPSQVTSVYNVEDDDLIFLNIGRYVPPKAQLDLVAAMGVLTEDLQDIHLFIVGGRGAMESRIREAVTDHELEDSVSVTGRVDQIHPFYAAADVFVSSSVGEGLPIVQLEAMAAGLPVVATNIPGVRELIIDGETGILVPPKDPRQLATAMSALAGPELRETYGQAGFRRVNEEYHVRKTAEDYVRLYRELGKGVSVS